MTLPRTLTPAREAVESALTTSTGETLSLASSGGLFQLLPPAAGTARGVALKAKPGVWVSFEGITSGPLLLQSDRHQLALTAKIVVSYWSGDPKNPTETVALQRAFEADVPRMKLALTCSPALEHAPDGSETGITGLALLDKGWTSTGPEPWPIEVGGPRVVRVTHRFPFLVELSTT